MMILTQEMGVAMNFFLKRRASQPLDFAKLFLKSDPRKAAQRCSFILLNTETCQTRKKRDPQLVGPDLTRYRIWL
jgi:hypothetical protein